MGEKEGKCMKKMIASVLAVLMCVALVPFTAIAATDTQAKIVITNEITTTGIDLTGKEFEVYQIFSATIDNDSETAAITYDWASDFEAYFTSLTGVETSVNAEAYVHNLYDSSTADLQTLVADLSEYIDDEGVAAETVISGNVTTSSGIQSLSSDELDAGYYLILDTSTNESTMVAGMLVALPVKDSNGDFTRDASVSLKGSQPSIDKEIWHNDLNTTGGWDNVGDYEIGDTVEFVLTAVIPADLTGYKAYTYVITDTMSSGLLLDTESLEISTSKTFDTLVEGALHTETFFTNDEEGRSFELTFDMIGIKEKFPTLEEFYVRYKATVTESAMIAIDAETNTVELQYSNNPYDSNSFGYDNDVVYSYTFAMDVLKTDSTGTNPLDDAVFALWVNPTDETLPNYQVYLTQDLEDPTVYYVTQTGTPLFEEDAEGNILKSDGYVVTGETGEFTINGLDDQITYVLVEYQAPDGYSKAEDVTFDITADYTSGVVVTTNNTNITVNNGVLNTTILNTSSELFPGTGGDGTTLFLVSGGVVMLAALAILIAKRKKDNE